MLLVSFIVSSLIEMVTGNCDACINSRCQSRRVLLQNVDITDQLAMDWINNILYAQLNSVINIAFYMNDYSIEKMHVVQIFETSGMVVKHDTRDLLTGDSNSQNIYRIRKGTNDIEIGYYGLLDGIISFMFYRNRLYFTKKGEKNIFYFDDEKNLIAARDLAPFTITDFVKTDRGAFFVANDTLYEYKRPFKKPPSVLATKKMHLSIDQFENVYFVSPAQKVVYKKNNLTNDIFVYAAYKKGNIDRFVIDKDNNVISYDATEKTLSIWLEERDTCTIVLPRCNIKINVHKPPPLDFNESDEEEEEVDEHNDNIVYDFFWKQSERLPDLD